MDIYQFKVNTIDGTQMSLETFKEKTLLIVNVASKCGFTPQYQDLQSLYEKYREKNFEILAFPCNQFLQQEPADNETIKNFCETTYKISFPLFAKIDVKGKEAHPLYQFLVSQASGIFCSKSIKWNFTKFLVNTDGKVIKRFAPCTKIANVEKALRRIIKL